MSKPPDNFGTDTISKAMSKPTLLDDLDAIDKRVDALLEDNANLRTERNVLLERLRGSPEMREVVCEIKQLKRDLDDHLPGACRRRLERLLRRLDESQ